jgi:hypothetical protein
VDVKMATKTFNTEMFEQTETLSALVHERYIAEGKSYETAQHLVAGYMQSFLVNLVCERFTQKEKLACVNTRIFMQKEAIAVAKSVRS